MLAHHIAIELFGKEYSPQGFVEHAVFIGGTVALLALAGVGLVTVCRRLASGAASRPGRA